MDIRLSPTEQTLLWSWRDELAIRFKTLRYLGDGWWIHCLSVSRITQDMLFKLIGISEISSQRFSRYSLQGYW
jgi:hypothetical protein